MTLDQFISSLDQYGKDLYVGEANSVWEQAIEKVRSDLWDMNITTKSSNIKAGTDGDDVYLELENYLLFQNYGVKAREDSKKPYNTNQESVEPQWGLSPSGGSIFEFQEDGNGWGASYSGLNAKGSFGVLGATSNSDYIIEDEYVRYVNAIIEQQIIN